MKFILSILNFSGYLESPQGVLGWILWFVLAAVIIWLLFRWRKYHPKWTERSTLVIFVFLVFVPLTALFVGLQFPDGAISAFSDMADTQPGGLLMLLSAIPWVFAAGLFGPIPAASLASLSGLLIALFNSHNPFVPLIYALIAAVFSTMLRQNYRTAFFRLISHPLAAAFLVSLIYPMLFITSNLLVVRGVIGARLDYGISHVGNSGLSFAGQLLIAAAIAEIVSLIWEKFLDQEKPLQPSPAESSLEVRLVFTLAPLVIVIMIAILIGQWASMAATNQELLGDRLGNVALSTSNSIPVALETGQNLINQLAGDPRLFNTADSSQLLLVLTEYLSRVPFFNQLVYLDANKNLIAGFPFSNNYPLTSSELEGIELAMRDVANQSFSLPPEIGGTSARIVFINAVRDDLGNLLGVILGRTSLDKNPFFTPVIQNLNSLSDFGGTGILLNEQGMILIHPNNNLVGSFYPQGDLIGNVGLIPNHIALDGSREMLHVEPVLGRAWVVLATIPTAEVQQAALESVILILVLMLLLMVLGYVLLRVVLKVVIGSIGELAEEARLISAGDLDRNIESKAVDEIGLLANTLEEMRIGMKSRVEEANRLLTVSKGVASALEMQAAVSPILHGALATGASSARLILTDAALPEYGKNMATEYSLGQSAEKYNKMDQQILSLTKQQPEVVLTNPARARLNNGDQPLPLSLIAMALQHEGVHYGALWVAYDKPRRFTEEDIRFLSTVAGQAALAAVNTRLYLSAELGRQRMEAILASTTEPVLVTDFQDNLLLINPAAKDLLGGEKFQLQGRPVKEIISEESLLDLLLFDREGEDKSPIEVKFKDGRVFYATASPVNIDQKQMGRVCLLRDVTHYKELDALKTEFVDTVSHDLRSPLTLMRGYATMLQMVGDLNEQQNGYINKIVTGVEGMSRLVNNLLDLGRIDVGVGLRLEVVPAAELLQQVAEALRLQAVQKQIDLNVELPEDAMPLVQVDQALLEQALYNLIENAIKYTDTGGKIDVSLNLHEKDLVSFIVKDDGIGIAPVDIPRLFERFFRAAGRKTREQRGSGLGLAIVKSIAERHGGSIQVDSQLGRGSTFTLRIPLRQP
jgi:PAS domain S-box-containing protein